MDAKSLHAHIESVPSNVTHMHIRNLKKRISETIADHISDVRQPEVLSWIEEPPEPDYGDLAVPCHRLSPVLKTDPQSISEELQNELPVPTGFERTENRGPYLNFFIDRAQLVEEVVQKVLRHGTDWCVPEVGEDEPVVIDYSSPNIAKPFSIGHLRSTAIGACLYRLYDELGFRVTGVNHLGDWGTQCGKQILAFRRWGDEEQLHQEGIYYLQDLYVRINQEIEEDPELRDEAREWFRKLESGDPDAVELWKMFREVSLSYLEDIYERLGVEFDEYTGESFYTDRTEDVIEEAKKAGVAEESEGALVIKFEEEEDTPPFLLRKADGTTLYSTRDLAAALYRHQEYEADRLLYVVATEQNLHFKQLFGALEKMGHDWVQHCEHVGFGLVQIEGSKMSTREGDVVLLEDILETGVEKTREIMSDRDFSEERKEQIAEDIGIGAVLFSDLKDRRTRDIQFDWDRAIGYDPNTKSFRGETGPYLQYTYVRLCGIRREFPGDLSEVPNTDRLDLPEEFQLAKLVASYPEVLVEAQENNSPSVIASYLIDLAQAFNTYYHDREKHQIVSDDMELSQARFALCESIRTILSSGLEIMGITPLERM